MSDQTSKQLFGNLVYLNARPRRTLGWFGAPGSQEAIKILTNDPLRITELPDTFFKVTEGWEDGWLLKWLLGDIGVVCYISYDNCKWTATVEHQNRGNASEWVTIYDVRDLLRRTVPTEKKP